MEKNYTGRQNQRIYSYVQDRLSEGTAKQVFDFEHRCNDIDVEIDMYSLSDPTVSVLVLQNHGDLFSKSMSIVTGRQEDISELEKRTKR